MSYKTCENCGGRIYKYGCVNCNEEDYIAEQNDESNLQNTTPHYPSVPINLERGDLYPEREVCPYCKSATVSFTTIDNMIQCCDCGKWYSRWFV